MRTARPAARLQPGARRQGGGAAQGVPGRGAPLAHGVARAVTGYAVEGGALVAQHRGGQTGLADPAQFAGYLGEAAAPTAILLKRNGLHIELLIDRSHPIGKDDPAGLADIVLESRHQHHHGLRGQRRGRGCGRTRWRCIATGSG